MAEPSDIVAPGSAPAWVTYCGTLAPLMAIGVTLSPIPTIQQVAKNKYVGGLPLLPYSSMIANAFVWGVYGLLKSESKIVVPNGIRLVLSIHYCRQFTLYTSPGATNLPGTVLQHWNGLVMIILFVLLVAAGMAKDVAAEMIGKLGVLIGMIMFASPLSAMKRVVETKSAESIPLPFTIACVVNCASWLIVGVLDMNDFNVYFPHYTGLSAGLAQLLLKGLYGNRKGSLLSPKVTELPSQRATQERLQ